jgi:hypothetical protein
MESDMNNPYQSRFNLIMSDPLNAMIPRVAGAGDCIDGIITMHNGLKVYDQSYYGRFSEILKLNGGVHEPSEEYVFGKIIERYRGKSPVMVELGSYWAFYSMWMKLIAPDSETICIDVDSNCLEVGLNHYDLNGFGGTFITERIGSSGIPVDGRIDLLHCDIQGDEVEMLRSESSRFNRSDIDYVFISTHSMKGHHQCTDLLNQYGYHIIAEVDFQRTFCEDGIIVASSPLLEPVRFELPRRT